MPAGQLIARRVPVTITEERVRVAWWLIALGWCLRAGVQAVGRHPGLVAGLVVIMVTVRSAGWWPLVFAAAVIIAVLIEWRLSFPAGFARFPRAWGAGWWVRSWRYAPGHWSRLAQRHGLTVRRRGPAGDHVEVPKITAVRVTATGEGVRLRLPHGMSPDDLDTRVVPLAHALRADRCTVWPDRPGSCWLLVVRRDTLASVLAPVEVPRADTPELVAKLLRGVPIGMTEHGTPWTLRLSGTHVLISGASNSGKGSTFQSLLSGLADAITCGLVEVVGVDPKGGMELGPVAPLLHTLAADNPEQMASCLEAQVRWMNARAAELAEARCRQHVPDWGSPHRVVLVDELMTLTALADRQTTTRIEKALGELLSKGRACGLTVVCSVVEPSKEVVRWRALVSTRVGLRLVEDSQVDMAMGDGARRRGAACDVIPEDTPGVGYVLEDGRRTPIRVRASYPTDAYLSWLCETYPAPAQAWPTLADDDGTITGADPRPRVVRLAHGAR